MKGWVYVISNRAMPDLVKVGFSTKDPELRAAELNHTGSPHPYLVEYELLIEAPRDIEQRVHSELAQQREAKEWFRCSAEQAIAAIKIVARSAGMHETYKRAERAKAEEIRLEQVAAREKTRAHEEATRARGSAVRALETQMSNEESQLYQHWAQRIHEAFPDSSFWAYWIGSSVLCFIGGALLFPKASDVAGFWLSVIVGAVVGHYLQDHFDGMRTKSKRYLSLAQQRDTQVAEVRVKVIACPHCQSAVRFDRIRAALTGSKSDRNCPKCNSAVQYPWK